MTNASILVGLQSSISNVHSHAGLPFADLFFGVYQRMEPTGFQVVVTLHAQHPIVPKLLAPCQDVQDHSTQQRDKFSREWQNK